MSGGHFNYVQYTIGEVADQMDELLVNIRDNSSWYFNQFKPETIKEIKYASDLLHLAQIYVNRIDWLISGDDGEDSFHARLASELEVVKKQKMKDRCDSLLVAMVGEKSVDAWWESKNKFFSMKSPKEVWLDDHESVYNYLLSQT